MPKVNFGSCDRCFSYNGLILEFDCNCGRSFCIDCIFSSFLSKGSYQKYKPQIFNQEFIKNFVDKLDQPYCYFCALKKQFCWFCRKSESTEENRLIRCQSSQCPFVFHQDCIKRIAKTVQTNDCQRHYCCGCQGRCVARDRAYTCYRCLKTVHLACCKGQHTFEKIDRTFVDLDDGDNIVLTAGICPSCAKQLKEEKHPAQSNDIKQLHREEHKNGTDCEPFVMLPQVLLGSKSPVLNFIPSIELENHSTVTAESDEQVIAANDGVAEFLLNSQAFPYLNQLHMLLSKRSNNFDINNYQPKYYFAVVSTIFKNFRSLFKDGFALAPQLSEQQLLNFVNQLIKDLVKYRFVIFTSTVSSRIPSTISVPQETSPEKVQPPQPRGTTGTLVSGSFSTIFSAPLSMNVEIQRPTGSTLVPNLQKIAAEIQQLNAELRCQIDRLPPDQCLIICQRGIAAKVDFRKQ